MKRMLSYGEELEFKRKYHHFFGDGRYRRNEPYYHCSRFKCLKSIETKGPYFNNYITFRAHQILNYMRLILPENRRYPNLKRWVNLRHDYEVVEDQELEDQEPEDQEPEDQEPEDQELEDQELEDQELEEMYPP